MMRGIRTEEAEALRALPEFAGLSDIDVERKEYALKERSTEALLCELQERALEAGFRLTVSYG